MDRRVRCANMRGGTSNTILFAARDFLEEASAAYHYVLDAFGNPVAGTMGAVVENDVLVIKGD